MLVIHWNKIGKTPKPLVSTYQKNVYTYIYIYIHIFIVNLLQWYVAPLFGSIWLKIKKKRSLANTSHLAVSCSSINSTFSSKLDVLHTPIFGSEILSMVWTQNIVFCCPLCNNKQVNWLLVFCCAPWNRHQLPHFLFAWFTSMLYLNTFRNQLTGGFNQSLKPAFLANMNRP